jgi:RNase P/RNase MRP subunit POP5
VTVKAKRGRRRYVAFRVADNCTHEQGLQAISRLQLTNIKGFKVIQYDRGRGIVRCAEPEKERLLACMKALEVLLPLRTSGTLRTLRETYFQEVKA